jgi:hypothetical protein
MIQSVNNPPAGPVVMAFYRGAETLSPSVAIDKNFHRGYSDFALHASVSKLLLEL